MERVRNLIRKHTKSLFDNSRTDSMGSLICTRNPTSTKKSKSAVWVMIAAHMDEIGFYVSHVDDLGYLWVNPAAVVVGTRYIQTVTESIHKTDLQAAVDLLSAWLPAVT